MFIKCDISPLLFDGRFKWDQKKKINRIHCLYLNLSLFLYVSMVQASLVGGLSLLPK